MQKENKRKYPNVETLPDNAMLVADYANSLGVTTSAIYAKIKRNKNDFQIVVFKGINFIIP